MSPPDPGQDRRDVPPPDRSRHPDPSTDPGRSQPFESLYRDPDAVRPRSHRTTARHYEPSLSPPENQPAGDVYHWLYRPEPEPSDADPEQGAPDEADVGTVLRSPDAGQASQIGSAPSDPLDADQESLLPSPPDAPDQRPSRRRVVVLFIVATLLLVGVITAVVLLGQDPGPRAVTPPIGTAPAPSTSAGSPAPGPTSAGATSSAPSTSPSPTPAGPYQGAVAPVAVQKTVADCTARPSKDGKGDPVRYDAPLASDGNLSTAWRCEGSGDGRELTFTFPAGSTIAEVGLVNGYTKVDPKTREDRYGEYRRILQVTWTFADGAVFTQDLTDSSRSVQQLRIPVQTTDQVRLTITKSTEPGDGAKSRDAVLISEVAFGSPPS